MLFSLLRMCTPYPLAWDDLSLHSEPALNVTFSKLTLPPAFHHVPSLSCCIFLHFIYSYLELYYTFTLLLFII